MLDDIVEPDGPGPSIFRLRGRALRGRVKSIRNERPIAKRLVDHSQLRQTQRHFLTQVDRYAGSLSMGQSAPDEPVAFMIGAEGYGKRSRLAYTERQGSGRAQNCSRSDSVASMPRPASRFPGTRIQVGKAKPGSKDFHWERSIVDVGFSGEYRTSLEAEKGSYRSKLRRWLEPTQNTHSPREEKSVREVIRLKKSSGSEGSRTLKHLGKTCPLPW